jgi:hypothetical protein
MFDQTNKSMLDPNDKSEAQQPPIPSIFQEEPKDKRLTEKNHTDELALISALEHVVTTSTVQLVGKIYSFKKTAHIPLRILLFLVFILSIGYCMFQVISSTITFASYQTVIATSTYYEAPPEFPTVSYCLQNAFDYNYAYEVIHNFTDDGTVQIQNYSRTADYLADVTAYYFSNLLRMYSNDPYQLGSNFGYHVDQSLLSCRFQNKACTTNDFMLWFDFEYGNCYRFNAGRDINGTEQLIKVSGQPGWKYGLSIELYTGNADLQEEFVANRGFRIVVLNKTNPVVMMQDFGLNVPCGQETNIAIKRSFINRLPAPYSNCLSSDVSQINWSQNDVLQFMYSQFVKDNHYDNGVWQWNFTVSYTQYICLKMCHQMNLFKTCGCLDITMPKSTALLEYYASNSCASFSQITCMTNFASNLFNDSSKLGVCYEKCPNECSEIRYNLHPSSSSYPTVVYANLLKNNPEFNRFINRYYQDVSVPFFNYSGRYQDLKDSIAKVNIFYEDLSYTQVDQVPALTYNDIIYVFQLLSVPAHNLHNNLFVFFLRFDVYLANIGGSLVSKA